MRIVAGKFRGARIEAPNGSTTRPTSDKVRQALFNVLEHGEPDVDFEGVRQVASWITPVPGGVGPMTRAMLLVNTIEAAEEQSA